jgi:uncharacterized cupin superfamily protein
MTSNTSIELNPAPINSNWIVEGTPTAKCAELSRSRDGTATTYIWTCTPGRFKWFYDSDETLYLFEGEVILDENLPTERRVGPGDTVFFPAGSHAMWHVRKAVRKIAFCRRALPGPLLKLIKIRRKLRNWRAIEHNHGFGTQEQKAGLA